MRGTTGTTPDSTTPLPTQEVSHEGRRRAVTALLPFPDLVAADLRTPWGQEWSQSDLLGQASMSRGWHTFANHEAFVLASRFELPTLSLVPRIFLVAMRIRRQMLASPGG